MASPQASIYASDLSISDKKGAFNDKFKWLSHTSRGPTYNSFAQLSDTPAGAFEWGSEGYGGCTNHGGELLYLTAPSPAEGLVSARGAFSTSNYATLSRTQVEFGGPSTFGFEIAKTHKAFEPGSNHGSGNVQYSSFELGDMVERGSFNLRWPFNEYYLDSHKQLTDALHDGPANHVGLCQMFSCTKDKTFFQVLRIQELKSENTTFAGSQVVLNIGGPIWFYSAFDKMNENTNSDALRAIDIYQFKPEDGGTIVLYWDTVDRIGLQIEVFRVDESVPSDKEQGYYRRLDLQESDSSWDSLTPETRNKNADANEQSEGGSFLAYNACEPLGDCKSATFVAAIRFVSSMQYAETRVPRSPELQEYVGISASSPNAIGPFWKTAFAEMRKSSNFILAYSEFSLIARALERILQVDLIPSYHNEPGLLETVHSKKTLCRTIVSNVFANPEVDLAALFWKMRFLVQAYMFMNRIHGVVDSKGEHQSKEAPGSLFCLDVSGDMNAMLATLEHQKFRIKDAINGVLRYLVDSLLKSSSRPPLVARSSVAGDPRYYYVTMTIWYACRHCNGPDWNWDWLSKEDILKQDCALFQLHSDSDNFEGSDVLKIPMLQWFHYGSILSLYESRKVANIPWPLASVRGKVAALASEARIAAAAKLASRQPYPADDEIFDRLSFLSDELGLEYIPDGKISDVASLSMKRIERRENTTELNPGWQQDGREECVAGPWETHALCHHSRLSVIKAKYMTPVKSGSLDHARDEIESIQKDLYSFVSGEGTLIPSWERSAARSRKGWLLSEATAVLATTLLIMNGLDMESWNKPNDTDEGQHRPEYRPMSADDLTKDYTTTPPARFDWELVKECRETNRLLRGQLKTLQKTGHSPPINWGVFALPRHYHPVDFLESLESNPELYEQHALSGLILPPSLSRFATDPKNLTKGYGFEDLVPLAKYFTLFDIRAAGDSRKLQDFEWDIGNYRYNASRTLEIARSKNLEQLYRENTQSDIPEVAGLNEDTYDLCWALYQSLVDQEVQHRFIVVRSPEVATNFFHNLNVAIENFEPFRQLFERYAVRRLSPATDKKPIVVNRMPLLDYIRSHPHDLEVGRGILRHLGKLVDQDSLKRIYENADKLPDQTILGNVLGQMQYVSTETRPINLGLPRSLVDLLFYVVHRAGGTNFGNHCFNFPNFYCDTRETWVAGITLRNWAVSGTGPSPTETRSTFAEEEPIYLPQHLRTTWERADLEEVWKGKDAKTKFCLLETLSFELETSSIIVSTNRFGDFSKCTVISDLISNDDMKLIVEEARKIWSIFIHQPQTGRCLVFLLVLGFLCRSIEKEYDQGIGILTPILSLNSNRNWTNNEVSETAPHEFELGLWCIDTLQKLQDALEVSTKRIFEAKEELLAQIADGPGRRSVVLEETCQGYLAEFESKLELLIAVNTRLESRIELKIRHQKSFSDVLAMQESQEVLWQKHYSLLEHGVSRLTYVTIVYLPPTLIAAILTIPDTQDVIAQHFGLGWFLGAIIILSLGTYILAYYVDRLLSMVTSILNFLGYPSPRSPNEQLKKSQKNSAANDNKIPLNLWSYIGISGPERDLEMSLPVERSSSGSSSLKRENSPP